jgi:hypothetical protein
MDSALGALPDDIDGLKAALIAERGEAYRGSGSGSSGSRTATERHHAAPSSQSRWRTAERTMTPAEASLKGVDRPRAIKERATL